MKKILMTVLITTVLMLGIMGGIIYSISKLYQKEASNKEKILSEELDLLPEGGSKKEYDLTKAEKITTEGGNPSMLSIDAIPLSKIYDTSVSEERSKLIEKKKRKSDYTFEAPMFVWNPYGTNDLSLYTYFETTEPVSIRYTIRIEDSEIPDFTRTLRNGETNNLARKHQYQISGFVPGKNNYMIWNMYNKSGKLVGTKIFSIEVPELASKADAQLSFKEGERLTKEKQTNGLYYVFGEKYIWLYDNSGILRGEIPMEASKSCQVLFQNNKIIYAINKNGFSAVNALGQVENVWRFEGYEQEEFVYNGYGQILMIATKEGKKRKTVSDTILSLDLKTGKTEEILDFTKIFPKVLKKEKQEKGKKKLDWISLNSLVSVDSDGIIVSSEKLSSIIRINNMGSQKPSIQYIIGDKKYWKDTSYKKYLYEKQGQSELAEEVQATAEAAGGILQKDVNVPEIFPTQYGPSYLEVENNSTLEESAYYLYVFYRNSTPNSCWCKYLVDESTELYSIEDSIEVPYCKADGNFNDKESNRIYTLPSLGEFIERDKDNLDIRIFELPSSCLVVKKYDMKKFWYE